jgi:hypothetical protein
VKVPAFIVIDRLEDSSKVDVPVEIPWEQLQWYLYSYCNDSFTHPILVALEYSGALDISLFMCVM